MLETIRLGAKGDLVKIAQYMINYAERKMADGEYNEHFAAEVSDWQAQHHLNADYIIGPKTWTAMAKAMPTCSTSKNKTNVYTCAIQLLIGGLTVDGVYGTKTKKGVAAYQAAAGLKADGICGQKTWTSLIVGKTEELSPISPSPANSGQEIDGNKVINNCVHYLQWDSKWKSKMFSNHNDKGQTIGNSGCGPSSMAMIMATFIDPSITPVEMCALAVANGYRTYSNGTAWGFYKFIFSKYEGFEKFVQTSSLSTLKAALQEGALAVCSMNSNDKQFWTKSGHFIVARGLDDTYIYANDPNNKTVPRKQEHSKFSSCMKQAFIFWPKKKLIETAPPIEDSVRLDKKIIDISKHQGKINFNTLKNNVSLVIARASCGSDKDIKIDEYASAMKERGIPFGVYCYSYAGDEAKAIDEAQKMIQYASKYEPLFYVMDAEESKITNAAIKAFVTELRKQGIKKIGCYCAHNRYKTYDYASLQNLFDFTWIPRYGKNDGTIAGATKPAYFCDLWQYTSTAKIDGISSNVDMNIITGDGHDLKWFLDK